MDRGGAHLIINQSASPHAKTIASLIEGIQARGLTVFARIDHAAGACEVGMELEEESVVLFGIGLRPGLQQEADAPGADPEGAVLA